MNESIFANLSYISFGISFVCLGVSILLFFYFRILSLWDELSGRKERREIREYRKQRKYQKKRNNFLSGKESCVTERISMTKTGEITSKLEGKEAKQNFDSEATSLLETYESDATELLEENATELLQDSGTELIQENGTTTILEAMGTTLLENGAFDKSDAYRLILNEMVIHTMEYI